MPRPSTGANLSITDLEQMLEHRRSELNKLMRQRSAVEKKLDAIDRRITRLGGSPGGGRRGGGGRNGSRARNEHSLMDTIEQVLRDNGKPMRVPEIVDAVLGTGYRSNSANFRGIVNQTLIKDKRFTAAERGLYQLRGGEGRSKREKSKGDGQGE